MTEKRGLASDEDIAHWNAVASVLPPLFRTVLDALEGERVLSGAAAQIAQLTNTRADRAEATLDAVREWLDDVYEDGTTWRDLRRLKQIVEAEQ